MCSREGCEKPIRAMGFCVGHYSKFKNDRNRERGIQRKNYYIAQATESDSLDTEDFWQFVKKELKIVQY